MQAATCLPEDAKAMAVKNVTVRDAHTNQGDGWAYIDVRSIPEFAQGHPAGAVNVPLLHRDERTGQMMPNRDFVAVIQANFAPDAKLLIGCQVGGRSAQAAQILASQGYQNVANVLGGYGGGPRDEGWTQAGLPTETEPEPGGSYRAFVEKTQGR
jgi:rhodanese-related sulfurtransferase